jgi:hypothetical protein
MTLVTEIMYTFPGVHLSLSKEIEKTAEIVIHFTAPPPPPKSDVLDKATEVIPRELQGPSPIRNGDYEMQIIGIRRKKIELDQVCDDILLC